MTESNDWLEYLYQTLHKPPLGVAERTERFHELVAMIAKAHKDEVREAFGGLEAKLPKKHTNSAAIMRRFFHGNPSQDWMDGYTTYRKEAKALIRKHKESI